MHGLYQRRERLRLLQNETSVLHSDGRQYLHIRIRFISLFLREIFDHQMTLVYIFQIDMSTYFPFKL